MRAPDPTAAARCLRGRRSPARRPGQRRPPAVREGVRRSPTRRAPSRPSAPGPTPSASTSWPARRGRSSVDEAATPRGRRPPGRAGRPSSGHRPRDGGPPDGRARCLRRGRRPGCDPVQRPRARPSGSPRCRGRSGRRSTSRPSTTARPIMWRPRGPPSTPGSRACSSTRPAEPHPGGTGAARRRGVAGSIAREVPTTLAGGLHAGNVAAALRDIPAVGVDVASGVEAPRAEGGGRSRTRSASPCSSSAPGRPATTVPTARSGRPRSTPACSTPTAPGAGGWSATSAGATCPRRSWPRSPSSRTAYGALRHDPVFWADLRELLGRFAGRPTALYRADRLAGGRSSTRPPAGRRPRGRPRPPAPALSQARGPAPTPAPTRSTTPSARPS